MGRRAARRVLPFLFILLLASCTPAAPAPQGAFYYLTGEGEFAPAADLSSLPAAAFVPWTRQVRVTDLLVHGQRLFLAVNGLGLAEVLIADGKIAFSKQYSWEYFFGRTVTRVIPLRNDLYCHVYFDSSFPDAAAPAAPLERLGLLRYTPNAPDAGFRPVAMKLMPPDESWEAVVARALGPGTLAFEWKRSLPGRTEFAYSAFDLETGAETKKPRNWFYKAAALEKLAAADNDPDLAGVLGAAAEILTAETPGCLVLFNYYDPAQDGERCFVHYDAGADRKRSSAYRVVPVSKTEAGLSALLPDGRVLLAPSPAAGQTREARLPPLPASFRYTGLAVHAGWLCAAWEKVDFYQVGRAGVVLLKLPSAR